MDLFLNSASAWEYLAFITIFLIAIFIDLGTHKKDKPVTLTNSAIWFGIWTAASLAFGAYIWMSRGVDDFSLYMTGWALEKTLALDNLFAFIVIFKAFGLMNPGMSHIQFRILYWGILGAIIFRVLFLGSGAFIAGLHPGTLLIFAALVAWSVVKLSQGSDDDSVDYANHWAGNFIKKIFPYEPSIASGKFFVKGAVTPLFLCLCVIEVADVMFAFDSMPVIIAVVQDPFLMITATLWAVAGLRAAYFMLLNAGDLFWALEKWIMRLLGFIALKLAYNGLAGDWWTDASGQGYGPIQWLGQQTGIDMIANAPSHFPNLVSLSIVVCFITAGIVESLMRKKPATA